ncbi:MAG TPA: hypothetical protein VLK65_18605, partial [Vicinamibacteria bacterium]|nr:hypothetical protein [Vicinamibacteria bacterium]
MTCRAGPNDLGSGFRPEEGQALTIPARALAPGDLVLLETGIVAASDARLLEQYAAHAGSCLDR